MKLSKTPPRPS